MSYLTWVWCVSDDRWSPTIQVCKGIKRILVLSVLSILAGPFLLRGTVMFFRDTKLYPNRIQSPTWAKSMGKVYFSTFTKYIFRFQKNILYSVTIEVYFSTSPFCVLYLLGRKIETLTVIRWDPSMPNRLDWKRDCRLCGWWRFLGLV